LVIGCGNPLRGDDAAGLRAAEAVAAWAIPGVRALAVHQLVPELAEQLAAADLAIFVDACVPAPSASIDALVEAHQLVPASGASALGHTGDPRALLGLAVAIYGRCPSAWSIGIQAWSFAFGVGLSPAGERGLAAALRQIQDIVDRGGWECENPTPNS
jgi:hydrogenase maturation protease